MATIAGKKKRNRDVVWGYNATLARSDCGSFLYSHSSTLPATALLGKLTSHLTLSVCGADLEAGRAEMVITRHGRERDNGISFLREGTRH